MAFFDEYGHEMTREHVIKAGYGHVLDGAPYYRCSWCDRKSWDPRAAGGRCGATRPDGSACGGTFRGPFAGG